ncbi:MAG: hypothetical protein KDI12_25745, partial [Anaerolineae bacterium]|nr:hypothetical protein [Anaerolineae bacterium]
VSKRDTIRRDLVPVREMDSHRPYQDSHGIWSAANRQRYTYDDSHRLLPRYPLLDGPRGVGNAHGVFHIQIGKGRVEDKPGSPLMGNVYFCDGWRVARVDKTGHVSTLLGWRSNGPGHNWQEDPIETGQLELVGDWSAVQGPHGLREPWGFVFVEGSTAVDHNAAPIPAEDNRQPHLVGPRLLVADSQNGRIIQAEFSPTRHGIPPKVTEFLTGISDPWECVQWHDGLIVSERGSHRICEYDIHTRQFRRVIVSGPDLAYVQPSPSRWVIRTAELEEIRKHDCVSPEGLYRLDDDDWLYYASAAMAQVKRVHLVTGEVEWGCDILTKFPTGLKFAKVAVSDGTFGPEGTMFVPQWNNTIPHAYLPGGERWIWGTGSSLAYDSSVAIHEGRLVMGGCREGLVEYKLRLPSDGDFDYAKYARGEREYSDKGYYLSHSVAGMSYTGEPPPYGISDDMDYYLDHGKYMQ